MRRRDVARNLAVSMVAGAWTEGVLRDVLSRRLPAAMRRHVPMMVAGLIEALPGGTAPPVRVVADTLDALTEFGAVYRYCLKRNAWPGPVLTPAVMAPVAALANLGLPQLQTVGDLADWLSIPVERIDYLADPVGRHEAHEEMAVNHYTYALIPKAGGQVRVIEAPKPGLKGLQRRILHRIVAPVPVHPDAFGFVAGRNCIGGAARHAGEAVVVRFDLKDFFPSLGAGRVHGLFRSLGYPEAVSRLLTGFCTTRTPERVVIRLRPEMRQAWRARHLPQGAPTSPALANLVAFRLDCRLSGLARSMDAAYSRYADDMTFSGDGQIVDRLLRVVPQIVAEEGMVLNHAKTRVMRAGARQVVTGLVVNDGINIDRRDFDRLKAVIHAIANPADGRIDDMAFRALVMGQIGWVEQVNRAKGEKLRGLLARALDRRAGP